MPLKNTTSECRSMCPSCPSKSSVIDCFETTPKMSTYLVAFVVSDLVKGAPEALRNQTTAYEISAWARKDYVDQLEFASSTSVEVIKYLEEYFDIPFPLPKIDIVAVPEFGFSAMENWGLIIYRESICLIPSDSTSEMAKHRAAKVIAHETAHQWFGNLVTPDFWNDLWLKEGFATYIGYLGVDKVFSDWDMDGRFVIDEIQVAMNIDSNVLSHPISYFVDTEAKIRSLFDPISYSKGASLIRMMHNFLGDSTFKTGLITYLKKFSYSNVKQDDLWDILTEQAYKDDALPKNVTMKEIMDTWTLQTGYPVVNVKRDSDTLTFTQSHFILPSKEAANKTTWWIPISVVSADKPDFQNTRPLTWLSDLEVSKSVNVPIQKSSWIIVNVNESGFYRVNYEDSNWNMLIEHYTTLPELTRGQLLDDSLYLARGDHLEYNVSLGFITRLSHDVSPLPWAAAEGQLMYLINMMSREPAYGLFKVFMNAAVRFVYKSMDYHDPQETHSKALLRSTIVTVACAVDLPECLNKAQILFREWMRNEDYNRIPADSKQAIYCTAIRRGGIEEWDFALRMFQQSSVATERELLLDGLGCATEPWLLSKYLNMTLLPDSPFSKQDGYRIFASVASNKFGHEIAVSHLLGNFKEVYDYYGEGFGTIRKMIESLPTFMNKESDQIRLETFANEVLDMGISSAHKAITKVLENVKNNIYWRTNRYPNLEKWLIEFNTKYHIV